MSTFSYPRSIAELHKTLSSLSKEDQINRAKLIATAYTRKYPVAPGPKEDLLLLRHCFTYLPVKDISIFMGHFNAGLSEDNTKSFWLGDPPMWASAFRMLHAAHNSSVWRMIWSMQPEECMADGKKINAKLAASLFCYVYDRDQQKRWKNSIINSAFGNNLIQDCTWLRTELIDGWDSLTLDQRQKTWMCLCELAHLPTLLSFSKVLGFEAQYNIVANVMGLENFQKLKPAAQFDMFFNAKKEIELPDEVFAFEPSL